jgi:aspartyl-tRNA(Asn)/glutamyl-tRNA(Gln) amidotransferase subunit B
MEEGSLRCDLNVSIAPLADSGESPEDLLRLAGNRVEVKNLNSIRQVQQAAKYEATRQAKAYLDSTPTGQETRTFDVKKGKTVVIRSKEGVKDYRFMPEPDLPPVVLDKEVSVRGYDVSYFLLLVIILYSFSFLIQAFGGMNLESFLEVSLPELPQDARDRLQNDYGLSDYLSGVLTGDPPAIQMFDIAVKEAGNQLVEMEKRDLRKVPETAANLLCNGLFALVREDDLKIKETLGEENSVKFSNVNGEQLGEIVALILEGTISNTMAKKLLKVLHHGDTEIGKKPRNVAKEYGFQLITGSEDLAKICNEVITQSPEEIERYQLGGKFAEKITKFLLGKAMASSRGNAHPERLNEVLMKVLDEVKPDIK